MASKKTGKEDNKKKGQNKYGYLTPKEKKEKRWDRASSVPSGNKKKKKDKKG